MIALLLLSALLPAARAGMTRSEQLKLGGGFVAGSTAAHALYWGLYPERQRPLALHFIPIAGPIMGFSERTSTPCEDERHGCPLRGMMAIYDGLMLGGQVAGLVMMSAAALQPPEQTLRLAPGAVSLHVRW